MIGSRILAAVTLAATAIALGGGGPRPEVGLASDAAVRGATARVLDAVDALEAAMAPALDAGRTGSARIVAGTADPAAPFLEAASAVGGSLDAADALRGSLAELRAARLARAPNARALPAGPDRAELDGIAAQLRSTAQAAAAFAEARQEAEAATARMASALDAAVAGDPDEAHEELLLASDGVDAMRPYVVSSPPLTVWVGTADAMIEAMQRLVDALEARDADAAERAEADFAAAAEDAAEADRALRIGIGEAGSAVASVPLGRLAAAFEAIGAVEASVRAEAGG